MNTTQLTKKLISIPSFVDEKNDERKFAAFLSDYLAAIPYLTVSKQDLGGGRFNVLAKTSGPAKLLLAGHMDTVEPKQGWKTDQFKAVEKKGNLYGLGAVDMKGSIASMLGALERFSSINGLSLLFYCDEEYDFVGMETFVKKTRTAPWDLIIVGEPTNLEIWNAHRGIVEISFSVRGTPGHAARPTSGRNAITATARAVEKLTDELVKQTHKQLGITTVNLAYLRGGTDRGEENGFRIVGSQGNNIPDFAEGVLDIRTTSPRLTGKQITTRLERLLKDESVSLENATVTHDLGMLDTKPSKLAKIERGIERATGKPATYLDASKKGYGDGQLIQQKFGTPVINLGVTGGNAHGIDEWVETQSIDTLTDIYAECIRTYCHADPEPKNGD